MNVFTRGVLADTSGRNTFVAIFIFIVSICASVWVLALVHGSTGVMKKRENEKVNVKEKEKGNIQGLPYCCMFEEGTPGRLALSNPAREDYTVLMMRSWKRQMRKRR